MANTRTALQEISENVDASMGVRQIDPIPRLSPVVAAKDVGRTPQRKFGKLRIEQVVPDPSQPRIEFDEEEIQQLAASIQKTGQLHPIRVRWDEETGAWIIVTGERRYRATVAAGLPEIDCFFHEGPIGDSEILEQQLVENLLRQDLKPLEEARGYNSLIKLNGWHGKQVAEALGVSTSRVSRALALLDLPEEVQQQVEDGVLSRSAAYELSKLGNEQTQRAVAQMTGAAGLSHKQTATAVRQRRGAKARKRQGIRQVFDAENGVKVTVTANRQGDYYDIQEALEQALGEVRLRIDNNIKL